MATTLMKRAANELERKNSQIKRVREANKAKEQQLVGGLSTLGGAAAAAYVDSKWGEGGRAEIKGVPTNAAAGAGLLAVAMVGGKSLGTGGAVLGHAGLGMLSCSAYSMLKDKFDEAD